MRRLWFALTHAPLFLLFLLEFGRQMIVANATVAWEVLTPGLKLRPGIIAVPTSCVTDVQIMLLANAITMTPGTLSLEVDTETREIYVHGLFVRSRDAFIDDIHALERILLRGLT